MLLEMRAAMRVFSKANALNKHIPRLVPGDATRGALISRPKKGTGDAEPEDGDADTAAPADKKQPKSARHSPCHRAESLECPPPKSAAPGAAEPSIKPPLARCT